MTRGNQRDLAREKNMKKQQQMNKAKIAAEKNGGLSTDKRMANDADIMRQKQQKALEKQAQAQKDAQDNKKVVKIDPLK